MNSDETIQRLLEFSLTRLEATVYLYLLQNGSSTGYEISKETGISRSNVYGTLSTLADKGAVYLCEGDTAKYIPVQICEFCDNKLLYMKKTRDVLVKEVNIKQDDCDGYITISGEKNITDKIRNLILAAKERIYLAAEYKLICEYSKDLQKVHSEGKKVVIVSESLPDDLSEVTFYNIEQKYGRVRLITDSHFVLTGEMGTNTENKCLYSGQKNFVEVFKEALKYEIELYKIGKDSNE